MKGAKIWRLIGIIAVAAAAGLLIAACPNLLMMQNPDEYWALLSDGEYHFEKGYDNDGNLWVSLSIGSNYKPITIPEIWWLGLSREIGTADAFTLNRVMVTRNPITGNVGYKRDDWSYEKFNVLWIEGGVPSTHANGALVAKNKLSHDNHSENNPGIIFMWDHDEEDKDHFYEAQYNPAFDRHDNYDAGILKVHETVFEKYAAFILTAQYGNGYIDYLIMPQPGQLKNYGEEDNRTFSYIFYIDVDHPPVNGQYLEHVWVTEYINSDKIDFTGTGDIVDPPPPYEPPPPEPPEPPKPPMPDADDYETFPLPPGDEETPVIVTPPERIGDRYVIISTASVGGAEVDTANTWLFSGKPIKNYWSDETKKRNPSLYNTMLAIKNSEGRSATWIWDRQDSWKYGVSGCFTVITASRFVIDEGMEVAESSVPFYLACDNAAAVYINGTLAGYTYKAFNAAPARTRTTPGETSDWRFTDLSENAFSGESQLWDTLYEFDIKPFIREGFNEILIMAANNDASGGRYNDTNNPAGLLFASQFSTRNKSTTSP